MYKTNWLVLGLCCIYLYLFKCIYDAQRFMQKLGLSLEWIFTLVCQRLLWIFPFPGVIINSIFFTLNSVTVWIISLILPTVREGIMVKMSYEKVLTESRMLWVVESNEPVLDGEMMADQDSWLSAWSFVWVKMNTFAFVEHSVWLQVLQKVRSNKQRES